MKYFFAALALLLLSSNSVFSQELHYGFRAGLNYSSINGPSESINGNSTETFGFGNGFVVGPLASLVFSEKYGFRGELLFSQKGGKYKYDGPSNRDFLASRNAIIATTGNEKLDVTITNNYIEIPLSAYYKVNQTLEVHGGAYLAYLLTSSGTGTTKYSGKTISGELTNEITQDLDYNYLRDKPNNTLGGSLVKRLQGEDASLPNTLTAYSGIPNANGALFNRLNYGLMAGVSIFFNNSLSINIRGMYGLSDLTRTSADYGRNLPRSQRSDFDKDITFQATIGLAF
jgi:hypothetical protein